MPKASVPGSRSIRSFFSGFKLALVVKARKKDRARLKAMLKAGQRIEALSRKAQDFARTLDTEPPNSANWKNAAVELCRLSAESLELARALGQPEILEIAENAAARVRTRCPIEAAAAGL